MQIKKKYIYIALGLWALVTVTYFTLCKIASDQAMLIFNKTMSAQKVLKGSVTLGSIDADIWGRVEFQNLVWLDIDGQPIVHVPQGRFKVRTWDIITRSISTSTIKELELDNALFAVRFNRKMQLDIFEQAQAKRVIDRAEQKEAVLSGNETAAELEHIAQEKIVVKERHPGDRHELNLDLAVSYTHLTLPTICSV